MLRKFLFLVFALFIFLPSTASAFLDVPTQDEFQQLVNKPTNRVQIPGLTYSNITTADEDGTTYLYIPYMGEFLSVIYRYFIVTAGVISVIMIIVAGMQWTASAGNSSTIESAKKRMTNALGGLVLVLGSYTILYTINPELVSFRSLKIKYIETETLENVYGSPDSDISEIGTSGNCNSYDTLFQKYASCLGSDWKALKAISAAETGCNAKADNKRGYVGMAQTNIDNCKFVFKSAGYENLVEYCTISNLQTAPVAIAFISLFQKDTADLIKKHCQNASPAEQGTAFHAVHNIPRAGKAYIRGGCKSDTAFADEFVRHYSKDTSSFLGDKVYKEQFKSIYESSGHEAYLRAIGQFKFNYSKNRAGPIFSNLGGTVFKLAPSGECPLKGENPFTVTPTAPQEVPDVRAPAGARQVQ